VAKRLIVPRRRDLLQLDVSGLSTIPPGGSVPRVEESTTRDSDEQIDYRATQQLPAYRSETPVRGGIQASHGHRHQPVKL
jgi:hypothetical protein